MGPDLIESYSFFRNGSEYSFEQVLHIGNTILNYLRLTIFHKFRVVEALCLFNQKLILLFGLPFPVGAHFCVSA